MLDLDTYKVFGSEGSGNQKKFWVGDTLIKLNSKYHEAEKEYSAYMLGKLLGFPVIEYKKGKYVYNSVTYNGCECKSFKQPKEESVTLYTVLEFVAIPANLSALDYFNITINAIEEYTSGKITKQHASKYLKNMVLFDYLICNSDRHLSNIEILHKEGTWRFAPYFDNGQTFLLRDGMPSKSQFEKSLRDFKTLPFSRNPVKNLIDLDYAKRFCKDIDINKVKSLNINSYHKKVILHQINTLL